MSKILRQTWQNYIPRRTKTKEHRSFVILNLVLRFATLLAIESADRHEMALAAENEKILIGSSMPLTGEHAEESRSLSDGANLYFNKVNTGGGVSGRKIINIVYDDADNPRMGLKNIKKLVNEDKVYSLFQVYGDKNLRAIKPFCDQNGVPIFAPISGSRYLRSPVSPIIFNVRAGDMSEVAEMMKYLVEIKKFKEISLFSEKNAYGVAGKSALQAAFNKYKMRRSSEGVASLKIADLDAEIDKIRATDPKAVIVWTDQKMAVAFIKRCLERKFKPLFMVSSFATTQKFLRDTSELDAEIYSAQSVPYIVSKGSRFTQEYDKLATAEGKVASSAGFEGYLNAAVFVEALRRVIANPGSSALRTGVEEMQNIDLGGVRVNFSASNHEGISRSTLVKVQSGRLNYLYYF